MKETDPSIQTVFRRLEGSKGKMPARMEMIWKLLRQGKTVLQSDVDAVWLKDPLPYLLKTSEQIVAMREFTSWHEPNAGFMLFRPAVERFMEQWTKLVEEEKGTSAEGRDNPPLLRMFQEASWAQDLEDTSSMGLLWNTTLRLLPIHWFPRLRVGDRLCTKPHVLRSQEEFQKELPCIDDSIIVLHNKGEIYRSKKEQNGQLWHL